MPMKSTTYELQKICILLVITPSSLKYAKNLKSLAYAIPEIWWGPKMPKLVKMGHSLITTFVSCHVTQCEVK